MLNITLQHLYHTLFESVFQHNQNSIKFKILLLHIQERVIQLELYLTRKLRTITRNVMQNPITPKLRTITQNVMQNPITPKLRTITQNVMQNPIT